MKITQLYSIPAVMAQEAWRLSRDPEVVTPLQEVLAVDAPVCEMPCYLLSFEDFTILEREIFTTPRNHVVWARTSRVDDPLQFTVPDEYADHIPVVRIQQAMRAAKAAGKPQDEWRALLPVLAHTSWLARISLRDLVKLAAYFDYLASKVRTCAERFKRIAAALRAHAPEGVTYKLDKFLHEPPVNKDVGGRTKFGSGWTVVYANVPLMLRAQIVRHRPIHFIDDLFNLLRSNSFYSKNLTALLQMELCAPDAFWQSLMAKRNCWIAQADLWQPLTIYFTDDTLPCKDGICPYVADNQLRMAGKDPNPPCPIYLNLTKQDQSPWLAAMLAHANAKPKWWKARI